MVGSQNQEQSPQFVSTPPSSHGPLLPSPSILPSSPHTIVPLVSIVALPGDTGDGCATVLVQGFLRMGRVVSP